jgi:hypothetical protein
MSRPILPRAADLAGIWLVGEDVAGPGCRVELTVRPAGTDHVAVADGKCLAGLGIAGVVAWRPAPDGIALADAGGATKGFFSRTKDGGYALGRPDRPLLFLRRT